MCVCLCAGDVDLESYALSVRVLDEETNTFVIKHYRIRKFDDGQVGVSDKKQFSSVVELVAHYRGQFSDWCFPLLQKSRHACTIECLVTIECFFTALLLINVNWAMNARALAVSISCERNNDSSLVMSFVAVLDKRYGLHSERNNKDWQQCTVEHMTLWWWWWWNCLFYRALKN